jgi:hypothetical protein
VGNALVAALLTMAGEHRLKAESMRNLYAGQQPVGDWAPAPFRRFAEWLREDTFKRADEQDGLASIYERFAHMIISEVAGQLILEEFERMEPGSAAMLGQVPPAWARGMYESVRYEFLLPPITPNTWPLPLTDLN